MYGCSWLETSSRRPAARRSQSAAQAGCIAGASSRPVAPLVRARSAQLLYSSLIPRSSGAGSGLAGPCQSPSVQSASPRRRASDRPRDQRRRRSSIHFRQFSLAIPQRRFGYPDEVAFGYPEEVEMTLRLPVDDFARTRLNQGNPRERSGGPTKRTDGRLTFNSTYKGELGAEEYSNNDLQASPLNKSEQTLNEDLVIK